MGASGGGTCARHVGSSAQSPGMMRQHREPDHLNLHISSLPGAWSAHPLRPDPHSPSRAVGTQGPSRGVPSAPSVHRGPREGASGTRTRMVPQQQVLPGQAHARMWTGSGGPPLCPLSPTQQLAMDMALGRAGAAHPADRLTWRIGNVGRAGDRQTPALSQAQGPHTAQLPSGLASHHIRPIVCPQRGRRACHPGPSPDLLPGQPAGPQGTWGPRPAHARPL